MVSPDFWKKTSFILGIMLLVSLFFDINVSLRPEVSTWLNFSYPKNLSSFPQGTPEPTEGSNLFPKAPTLVPTSGLWPTPNPGLNQTVKTKNESPGEGSPSVLGLTFSNDGYNQLLAWEKEIKLNESQLSEFAGFDVLMPCCSYKLTVAKYEENCQCGHHLAAYGLIKKMIINGSFSRGQIQTEVGRWIAYFFPNEGNGQTGGC